MHQRSRSPKVGDPAPRTCISMLIRSFPENQLLCQQAAEVAKQLGHIGIHIPSLFRIARGIVGEPEHRTSKIATFL